MSKCTHITKISKKKKFDTCVNIVFDEIKAILLLFHAKFKPKVQYLIPPYHCIVAVDQVVRKLPLKHQHHNDCCHNHHNGLFRHQNNHYHCPQNNHYHGDHLYHQNNTCAVWPSQSHQPTEDQMEVFDLQPLTIIMMMTNMRLISMLMAMWW